jgi:ABC-2 type transport system ATP-binding protein
MSRTVIEAKGLTKRYNGRAVVDGIDLTVNEGEALGLLGPNGAGKTTTILMLLGLTEATSGSVRILGKDPMREPLSVKREVGYLPDQVGFYDNLSGRENLGYTARLGGLSGSEASERMNKALERVNLLDVADRRVGTYSRGMRQRLGLAELLMRRCKVVILDEPTSGLDPQSTQELLSIIQQFTQDGTTVLISSHLLDVVQSICTRVALFNSGRIGFVGTPEELSRRVDEASFRIEVDGEGIDPDKVKQVPGVTEVQAKPTGGWQVAAQSDIRVELAEKIITSGGKLKRLDAHRMGLSEAYTKYFQETPHEA